ncbi:MAG: proline--tRNA ligase, partial [Halobacteriaceae archaeon]
ATSHHLGQTFAEAFDITFADAEERERTAHTASWGISWRALGALVMTHSDDQGLVLPPTVAPEQVVVVPIWQEDTREDVRQYATELAADLDEEFRVHLDDRDERNPGFKFNEWELKGVPLRVEVGPAELEAAELTLVDRPDGEQVTVDRADAVAAVEERLDEVYEKLYDAAEQRLVENVREADSIENILGTIGRHGGYVRAPWCGDEACETAVKEEIAADIVMVPFEEDSPAREHADRGDAATPEHGPDDDCAVCGEPAETTAYFARSY